MPGAAAFELGIDAGAVVQFGDQDEQASQCGDACPQADIGAAAGHVGGDRDAADLAGLGDDLGFVGELAGVEDLVRQPGLGEAAGQFEGIGDRAGADENRSAGHVQVDDAGGDGFPFVGQCGEDLGGKRFAAARGVRGERGDGEPVGGLELGGGGECGAGQPGEVGEAAEVVLEGDAGERLGAG